MTTARYRLVGIDADGNETERIDLEAAQIGAGDVVLICPVAGEVFTSEIRDGLADALNRLSIRYLLAPVPVQVHHLKRSE